MAVGGIPPPPVEKSAVASLDRSGVTRSGDDNDDAFVWVTADFETWRKSDSPDLGGPQFQTIYDISSELEATSDSSVPAATQ